MRAVMASHTVTLPAMWTCEGQMPFEIHSNKHSVTCIFAFLQDAAPAFNFSRQYLYQEQLHGLEGRPSAAAQPSSKGLTNISNAADGDGPPPHHGPQWALLRFSQPVTAPAVRIQGLGDSDFFCKGVDRRKLRVCSTIACSLSPWAGSLDRGPAQHITNIDVSMLHVLQLQYMLGSGVDRRKPTTARDAQFWL